LADAGYALVYRNGDFWWELDLEKKETDKKYKK
jgi:hypothetical protein